MSGVQKVRPNYINNGVNNRKLNHKPSHLKPIGGYTAVWDDVRVQTSTPSSELQTKTTLAETNMQVEKAS